MSVTEPAASAAFLVRPPAPADPHPTDDPTWELLDRGTGRVVAAAHLRPVVTAFAGATERAHLLRVVTPSAEAGSDGATSQSGPALSVLLAAVAEGTRGLLVCAGPDGRTAAVLHGAGWGGVRVGPELRAVLDPVAWLRRWGVPVPGALAAVTRGFAGVLTRAGARGGREAGGTLPFELTDWSHPVVRRALATQHAVAIRRVWSVEELRRALPLGGRAGWNGDAPAAPTFPHPAGSAVHPHSLAGRRGADARQPVAPFVRAWAVEGSPSQGGPGVLAWRPVMRGALPAAELAWAAGGRAAVESLLRAVLRQAASEGVVTAVARSPHPEWTGLLQRAGFGTGVGPWNGRRRRTVLMFRTDSADRAAPLVAGNEWNWLWHPADAE